jgi:hypothetical protein
MYRQRLKLAHDIKTWLEVENYYWMVKRFLIFDVDQNLNIFLIFLDKNEIMKQYGLKAQNIRFMAEEMNSELQCEVDQVDLDYVAEARCSEYGYMDEAKMGSGPDYEVGWGYGGYKGSEGHLGGGGRDGDGGGGRGGVGDGGNEGLEIGDPHYKVDYDNFEGPRKRAFWEYEDRYHVQPGTTSVLGLKSHVAHNEDSRVTPEIGHDGDGKVGGKGRAKGGVKFDGGQKSGLQFGGGLKGEGEGKADGKLKGTYGIELTTQLGGDAKKNG